MRALDKLNFKLTNKIDNPSNINFDILGLHKKRTIVLGELILTEYYRDYDGVTYSDKILEEHREFVRDNITKIVISRNTRINYFLENDEIGYTKVWTKYYNTDEGIQEGINRRNNIVNGAKSYLLSMIGETNAFDFLLDVKTQLNYYLDGYKTPLNNAINNSVKPYITTEIKTNLLSMINYD